jgi:hypothetical protein
MMGFHTVGGVGGGQPGGNPNTFTKLDLKQNTDSRRTKFSASKNTLGSNDSLSTSSIIEEEKERKVKPSVAHIPYPDHKFISVDESSSTFKPS